MDKLSKKLINQEQRHMLSIFIENKCVELMHPEVKLLLQDLSLRGVPYIALSAWSTSLYESIQKSEQVRLNHFD